MGLKGIQIGGGEDQRPVVPIDIFDRLTLRGPIKGIWQPQADALNSWHKVRSERDVVIQMNTGGGKTLVGLLAAQSLVNETSGHVLYVCPNNQLVEQTLIRAHELGMAPAHRYKGVWHNKEVFQAGESFAITNYATLFNGLSSLSKEEVHAVIFDDAHVADGYIRAAYTVALTGGTSAFKAILGIVRPYFAAGAYGSIFQDIAQGNPNTLLFIPTFVLWRERVKVRQALLDSGIDEHDNLKYPWGHLKDQLGSCCMLMTGQRIEISPPVLPVGHLPYFQGETRRLYLTATLPSQEAFARTFGVGSPTTIQPEGKTGDPQRLFVLVPGSDDDKQRQAALKLIEGKKACVISPSTKRASRWCPPGVVFGSEEGHGGIQAFTESKEPKLLALVARYDGIDLPGDACRVLLLDSLPIGEHLLDRFLDQSVSTGAGLRSHRATRVVQAIGRIFRSNTDHGAVLIVGPDLQAWMRSPHNQAYLPPSIQRQLQLAGELFKNVQVGTTSWDELLDAMLQGSKEWDALYSKSIDRFGVKSVASKENWYRDSLVGEREAYLLVWGRQYGKAATRYQALAKSVESEDSRLAAWYQHWAGLCLMHLDQYDSAGIEFVKACNCRAELGRPRESGPQAEAKQSYRAGPQALTLAERFEKNRPKLAKLLFSVQSHLMYGPETGKAEQAMADLGELLGLQVTRPDKEEKTGPDVLWHDTARKQVRAFELKTDKKETGQYKKEEIGQCHDHSEWVSKAFPEADADLAIVGRALRVVDQANPAETLRVIELPGFIDCVERVALMMEALDAEVHIPIAERCERWLRHYGLAWPQCVDSLPGRLASDLKHDLTSDE